VETKSGLIAEATVVIDAPRQRVWKALVTPREIAEYMFGARVVSDWLPGSAITWSGEWQGKPFADKGVIRDLIPGELLRYTHYSPRSGRPDKPGNYHTVTITLSGDGNGTVVTLTQDNNHSEEGRRESQQNWVTMLGALKRVIEGSASRQAESRTAVTGDG
jgi:uncharacterized protein YndB with AHSA1/START domain